MDKAKYKLVIWDVDTSEGLLSSAEYTIKKCGYEMPAEEVLKTFVGPRIQDSLARVYGLRGGELEYAVKVFREHYKEEDVYKAEIYPGIYTVLKRLREAGCHIAVATNKRQDFTDMLMRKYQLADMIQVVYGTDMEGKLTKFDLIRKCMDRFSECGCRDTVMIGDSSYDAIAAQQAGIDFIGVTYGFDFQTHEDIGKWTHVGSADTAGRLLDYLMER